MSGKEVAQFFGGLREKVHEETNRMFEDENSFTDAEFNIVSPISKQQFNELYDYCEPVPVDDCLRYVSKEDLLCLLCKLRQGFSDEFLKILFKYSSRQATSLAVSLARRSLAARFVTENIGFQSITRQDYIEQHVNDFSNQLYNNEPRNRKAIVYNDCTYLDIEKSACFQALRNSYCVHKGKHLIKPSVFVASDGYILDIQGPYFSNAANNDANILMSEFARDVDGMRTWFQNGDIFVVDRGYRDALQPLQEMGVVFKMPALLQPGASQLTTEEANASRVITKTRWIVEARNGHLQSIFKFFGNAISTAHIPSLNDFLRIAGALINRYHGPIVMQNATADFAIEILRQAQEVNVVQARVDAEKLRQKRGRWVPLNADHLPLFPEVTLDYLKRLTFGTYQVELSPSYIQDTVLRNDDEDAEDDQVLELDINTNENGFIRVRIFSRFRTATRHQIWIAFNEEYRNDDDEDKPILGYYCTYKTGARTLGACSHVTAVIWYLGYARNQNHVKYPSLTVLHSVINARLYNRDVI